MISCAAALSSTLERIWPEDRSKHSQLDPAKSKSEYLYDMIQELSPTTDTQRSLQARALNMAFDSDKDAC